MRIIIAGGRAFNDYLFVRNMFDNNFRKSDYEIISGNARGADALGEKLAKEYGFKLTLFPADWDKYGKSAGYIRNDKMARYASQEEAALLAFWDGKSKGTKSMIDLALKNKIHVLVFNIPVKEGYYGIN